MFVLISRIIYSIERTVLGVANDPWDHVPRLLLHQFNTTEVSRAADSR